MRDLRAIRAWGDDHERGIEAGASDYVTKPVDTDHLMRALARYLQDG